MKARFEDAIAFAAFTALTNNVFSMLLAVLFATGMFQLKYTIVNTWTWWMKKVILRIKFSKVASNMVRGTTYGMSIVRDNIKELHGTTKDFV